MPLSQSITFRGQLQGEVQDFLDAHGVACVDTTHAILDLIVEIARYEEEGRRLFPSILVCSSLSEALAFVQGADPLTIGRGPKGPRTATLGLKKCAPLTKDAWTMFIERQSTEFHYGVFRPDQLPTSVDVRATVSSLPFEVKGLFLMAPIAERTVELTGPANHSLVVHLSAVRTTAPAPGAALTALLDSVTQDAGESVRESLRTYLDSTLGRALVEGHGTLVAVVEAGKALPPDLANDARLFASPIELQRVVATFLESHNVASLTALRAYSSLLEGMLGSDGITIVRSDGALVGYNAFVRLQQATADRPSELAGGARRRAFTALCSLIARGDVLGSFIRSSNGTSEFEALQRGGAA